MSVDPRDHPIEFNFVARSSDTAKHTHRIFIERADDCKRVWKCVTYYPERIQMYKLNDLNNETVLSRLAPLLHEIKSDTDTYDYIDIMIPGYPSLRIDPMYSMSITYNVSNMCKMVFEVLRTWAPTKVNSSCGLCHSCCGQCVEETLVEKTE